MTNQDRQSAALPRWEPVAIRVGAGSLPRPIAVSAAGDSRYRCRLSAAARPASAADPPRRHRQRRRWPACCCSASSGCGGGSPAAPSSSTSSTPWLASAIEENFGSHEHVEVGGTQIERTDNGGAAVRIRDIVVRDPDGTVVASAPKAEVHVSGLSLLSGHMRAESLNLVGAELEVRIEQNGEVTVFAGANKHPLATAHGTGRRRRGAWRPASGGRGAVAMTPAAAAPRTVRLAAPAAARRGAEQTSDIFAALLTWIDGIGETGLDGHELRELGLKDGNLTVDDERTGKRLGFREHHAQPGAAARRRRRRSPSARRIAEQPWATDCFDQADPQWLPQHRARSPACSGQRSLLGDLASATASCKPTCRYPQACAAKSEPMACRSGLTGRIVADARFHRRADDAMAASISTTPSSSSTWDAGRPRAVGAVPNHIRRQPHHADGEVEAPEQARR